MSYANLPKKYPGMYKQDPETGKWSLILAAGKKHPLCQVKFCTRKSDKGKGHGRALTCVACRHRIGRANEPILACYRAVENKARRRKIPFTLTYEYFEALCLRTGYHLDRGREGHELHLDRKNALLGYSDDNVQILTATQNCRKSRQEAYRTLDEWEGGDGYEQEATNKVTYEPLLADDEDPF
jgi:hypothetical protein